MFWNLTKFRKNRFFWKKSLFPIFLKFQRNGFSRVSDFFTWFLWKMKLCIHIFECTSFYTLTSFLPPFLTTRISCEIKSKKMRLVRFHSSKRGGKKLLGGVKNFPILKCGASAFSWTKNYSFISKSHSCSFLEKKTTKNHPGCGLGDLL